MKRNFTDEILSKRNRNIKRSMRMRIAFAKFFLIADSFNYIKDKIDSKSSFKNELIKYIPIAVVTMLENYFKDLFREIISNNKKCLENVLLLKDIKIDLATMIKAQHNSLTIADLVSHLIPVNNRKDLIISLSTLLGEDFVELFKNQLLSEKSLEETHYYKNIFQSVERAFELRHIFVHEYAFKVKPKLNEVKNILFDCYMFINISELVFIDYLRNNSNPTSLQT